MKNNKKIKKIVGSFLPFGKKKKSPPFQEAPDNLFSNQTLSIVDLICEGEIEGFASDDPLKSIYLNNIPIKDDNGNFNFPQISVEFRKGYEYQESIFLNSFEYRTNSINKKIYKSLPKGATYIIRDNNVSIIKVGLKTGVVTKNTPSQNKISGHDIDYAIFINNAKVLQARISGKTSSGGYNKEHLIPVSHYFNQGAKELVVTVERISPDPKTILEQNDLYFDYVVECVAGKLNHPHSVMCGMLFDSRVFSSLPNRTYHLKLLKIQLPSNYNPITRTYTGVWDGTFSSPQWTDNPAWILYDLITNKRYGLGEFFKEDNLDKWKLYEIGKYCDELIPTGEKDSNDNDILEPRFSCNVILTSRDEALSVLNQFTTIFRGMPVWGSSIVTFSQDKPSNVITQFTNANISNKGFNYSSSQLMQRYSVAVVYFFNKNNNFEKEAVYVEDQDAIKRFGYKEIEINAFGTTSKAQAYRVGRWAIYSSYNETEVVSFETSFEALYLSPGDVFQVLDNDRHLARRGGRIVSINSEKNVVELDSEVYINSNTKNLLHLLVPKGNLSYNEITNFSDYEAFYKQSLIQTLPVSGDGAFTTGTLSVSGNFSGIIDPYNTIWVLESNSFNPIDYYYQNQDEFNTILESMQNNFDPTNRQKLYSFEPRLYRVLSIREQEDGIFEIAGLQYSQNKYDYVELGIVSDDASYVLPPSQNIELSPPSNFNLVYSFSGVGSIKANINFSWNHSSSKNVFSDLLYYLSYENYSNNTTGFLGETSNTQIFITGINTGDYTFKIQSKLISPSKLSFANSVNANLTNQNITSGYYVTGLYLQNYVDNTGIFEGDSPIFGWFINDDSIKDNISGYYYRVFNSSNQLIHSGISLSNSYEYPLSLNITNNGNPLRDIKFDVGLVSYDNSKFGFSERILVSNPAPIKPILNTDFTLTGNLNSATLSQSFILNESELLFSRIFYSTSGFTTGDINISGIPKNPIIQYRDYSINYNYNFPIQPNTLYYVCYANVDDFGTYRLNYSDISTIETFGASNIPPQTPSSFVLLTENVTGNFGESCRLIGQWNLNTENTLYYNFEYKESGSLNSYVSNLTSNNYYIVENVKPSTPYLARLKAVNGFGLSSDYVSGSITTLNITQDLNPQIGSVFLQHTGSTVYSDSYALCTGQLVNTGEYKKLFNIFGYQYGGSGNQFALPSGKWNDDFYFFMRVK